MSFILHSVGRLTTQLEHLLCNERSQEVREFYLSLLVRFLSVP